MIAYIAKACLAVSGALILAASAAEHAALITGIISGAAGVVATVVAVRLGQMNAWRSRAEAAEGQVRQLEQDLEFTRGKIASLESLPAIAEVLKVLTRLVGLLEQHDRDERQAWRGITEALGKITACLGASPIDTREEES